MKETTIQAKLLLLLALFFYNTEKIQAQCPSQTDVFNYITSSQNWLFCENEGIFDLTTYLNPEYPVGDFFITDPTFAAALVTTTQLDVSQIAGQLIGVSVTYEVSIGGQLCSYPNLTFTQVAESPALDFSSIENVNNQSYCEDTSPFLINPMVTGAPGAAAIVSVNSGNEQATSLIYNPANSGNTIDTIIITYGAGCFIVDTFYVNITPQPILNNTDTLFTDQTNYTLNATPAGGDFYINATPIGVDTIDVSQLTAGTTINIDYDINGCAAETEQIIIAAPPVIIPPDTTDNGTIMEIPVFVPNVFTPNRDQTNDKLYVRGNSIFSLNFKIFDRWGNKVFETKDQAEAWEGYNTNGIELNAGVYFYQLLYTTQEGGAEILKKGEITLIR